VEALTAYDALHQWRLFSQRSGGPVQTDVSASLQMIAVNLALWNLIVLAFVRGF